MVVRFAGRSKTQRRLFAGWLFLLFGFLATSGEETAMLSLWSWLHALDHEHAHDGAVTSTISLFGDLGWAIGPIAAGILYGVIGPTWAIVISAFPILCTWVVYQCLMHKHNPHLHIDQTFIIRIPHRRRHKS